MAEYRNRTTGEVKTQSEWKAAHPNMSLPRVWNSNVLDALNIDPVFASPKATTTAYQTSVRDGVEQDSKGNWVEKHVARDMFADTTVDGVTTTKAQHEAAYQATLDANAAAELRVKRNTKLAETDFYALSDVVMLSDMTTYRQALRDLPTHKNWPNLSDSDWPTKP
tara:strand:- start:368 stop:865 length:498 start_codon:yes stop_codon:yes gene_type:complete